MEFGTSRKGKVHSAACCANYVRWLRAQHQEAAEAAERERRAMRMEPSPEWLGDHGLYCVRLIVLRVVRWSWVSTLWIIRSSLRCLEVRLKSLILVSCQSVERSGRPDVVKRPLERSDVHGMDVGSDDGGYRPSLVDDQELETARPPSSPNVEVAQSESAHATLRGSKRSAEAQLERESRKQPLEVDDMDQGREDSVLVDDVNATDDFASVVSILKLSESFTGPDLVFEDESLQSVVCRILLLKGC